MPDLLHPRLTTGAMNLDTSLILKSLPKVELHVHIDGALRTQTISELAREQRIPLPTYDPVELEKFVTVTENCRSLSDFLSTFDVFYPVLKNPHAVERMTYELCEDLAKQNVVYAEIRFAPVLQSAPGFPLEEVVRCSLRGLNRARKDFQIDARLLLCCYRSEPPPTSVETVRLAQKYRGDGVVGIDFAGDETRFPASFHTDAFRLARQYDLPITVHAGEAGPVSNIREAIFELGAKRLGHATRLLDDPNLADMVCEKQIPIEICLTSNVQTQVVRDYREHPFPEFLRRGMFVTLNTDDPRVSNTTLEHEFSIAMKYYGLSLSDIARLILNAARASFADDMSEVLKRVEGPLRSYL